jgi:Ser/Thr protein kinase RdoA (MazF antagonist)
MTITPALHEAAIRLLGACEPSATMGTSVARVTTAIGTEFIVKQHRSREKHDREVYAYRHWTHALGLSAPQLVAIHDPAMIIITTALPGEPGPGDGTAAIFRQVGALLRRFHDAESPVELPRFRDWLQDRERHWSSQARTLLSDAEAGVVAGHLAALCEGPVLRGSPCHLDFQPRNWLVSQSGNVSLIDYEHSRIDLTVRDFVRLRFRVWTARPDLRDAFFDGYGRPLTEDEDELVWHLGALDALTALARAHQTGDKELTAAGLATLRQLMDRQ